MKKIVFAAAAAATIAFPAAASAQESAAETYIGVSAGLHDLGADDIGDDFGVDVDDSSPIFGVVAGVDFPVGGSAFAGIEGNYHIGTNAIDSEYGASVRFGFQAEGGAKYYVRGGYQEIDFDFAEMLDVDPALFAGLDDTDGDYLVGVGADFPVGKGALRANLDTVSFDTVRGTVGYVFKF